MHLCRLSLSDEARRLLRGKNIVLVLDDLSSYANRGAELLRYIKEVESEAGTCGVVATCRDGPELEILRNRREGEPLSPGGADRLYERFRMRLELVKLTKPEKKHLAKVARQRLGERAIDAALTPGDVVLAGKKGAMRQRFRDLRSVDQDALRVLQLLDVADLSPTHQRIQQVIQEVFGRTAFRESAFIRDALKRLTERGFVSRPSDANPVQPELAYVGHRGGVVAYIKGRTPQSDLMRLLPTLKSLQDGEGLVTLGRTLGVDHQRWDDALDCFNQTISLDEGNAAAWGNKGYALSRQDRYEPALVCYDRALEIDEDYAVAWNSKGYALGELGEYKDALVCFDRALDINEDYAAAWNRKGYTLVGLDRSEEALDCFERAVELSEADAAAWGRKGYMLVEYGWPGVALKCYNRALEIDERDNTPWRNKGYAFSQLEKYKEAIDCYDRALELDETDAAAWRNKGYAFSQLSRLGEALGCYDRSTEIDEDEAETWKSKGYALVEMGEYEKALECFDRAADLDETDAAAWRKKGYAFVELGEYEKALDCYDRSIEIDEDDATTWKNKAYAIGYKLRRMS